MTTTATTWTTRRRDNARYHHHDTRPVPASPQCRSCAPAPSSSRLRSGCLAMSTVHVLRAVETALMSVPSSPQPDAPESAPRTRRNGYLDRTLTLLHFTRAAAAPSQGQALRPGRPGIFTPSARSPRTRKDTPSPLVRTRRGAGGTARDRPPSPLFLGHRAFMDAPSPHPLHVGERRRATSPRRFEFETRGGAQMERTGLRQAPSRCFL
ncbi:hypothetical protein C8J57DRAFT_1727567, partial [Mycena rebaudengoi]